MKDVLVVSEMMFSGVHLTPTSSFLKMNNNEEVVHIRRSIKILIV